MRRLTALPVVIDIHAKRHHAELVSITVTALVGGSTRVSAEVSHRTNLMQTAYETDVRFPAIGSMTSQVAAAYGEVIKIASTIAAHFEMAGEMDDRDHDVAVDALMNMYWQEGK